ncbi:MAG: hypothetical protein HKN10_17045 [Myxococcales bacterium]|nr:hypothetical protein [Myxococcales bacterium]
MESKSPNHRRAAALLALAFAVSGGGCSGSDSDPGSGGTAGAGGTAGTGGTTGNENPCLESGNPACSTATLENGFGEIRVFVDEQRVEAVATPQSFATSQKQAYASFTLFGSEGTVSSSTSQPGDTFSEVMCAEYWIESYIESMEGQWFNVTFTESGGESAPLTVRATSEGGSTYNVQATWGTFPCIDRVSSPACDAAFGSAPSYTLCNANASGCEIWFQTPNRATELTCDQVCNGQCVGAYDDNMQIPCTRSAQVTCGETLADGVCLCSL